MLRDRWDPHALHFMSRMLLLGLNRLASLLYHWLKGLHFHVHFLIGHLVHLFVAISAMLRSVVGVATGFENGRLRSVYESVRGDNIECAC